MKRYILNNKWMLGLIFFTALLLAVCNIGLSFSMGKFTDAAVGLKKEQLLLYGILSLISLFLIFTKVSYLRMTNLKIAAIIQTLL